MMSTQDLNPPELLAPVRVRVLRPFCVQGARVEIGTEIELPRHVAVDLVTQGKAEPLTPLAARPRSCSAPRDELWGAGVG